MISPVAAEKKRLEKARRAMDLFCSDLADTCGRPERDDLTREIYLAAQQAGEQLDAVEAGEPRWVAEADRVLRRLVTKTSWAGDDVDSSDLEREIGKNEADVVVCLERADEFFAPYTPDRHVRVRLAMCLYDFAFVRIDEFADPEEGADRDDADRATVLVPAEPQGIAERDRARSLLMLGRTVRWGGIVLAVIGILLTGAVWLIPMAFVALLASWMLIDKKALGEAVETKALSPAETKQKLIEDFVKSPEGRKVLAEHVSSRCSGACEKRGTYPDNVYRGLTVVETELAELRDLWDSAPETGSLFARPKRRSDRED